MKIETKEIYKCDFCNKLYQLKRFAEYHELMCGKNPANQRLCFGCDNMVKKKTEIYDDRCYVPDSERKVDLFYCRAKKIFLHTPQNEIKGNAFDLGDELNEPMPKQCDLYKEETYIV